MRAIMIFVAGLTGTAGGLTAGPAEAEGASWGCQVLLCAASKSPSWHGVPYCVPPMTRLIAAMSRPGFSWPICHEANAGKPGRKIYEDCPTGTTVGYSSQGDNGGRGEPDQCIKTVDVCRSPSRLETNVASTGLTINRRYDREAESCIQEIATPRPRRADPWFFDIPNDTGVKERFWFNLNH
ncbi:hypothetical protein F4V89_29000 [Neorhizobium galegae]|uniref:hypothetical protein n=1 Tax=Neorhizobium galegae TaxID=399 RepID=UPI00062128AB|nr:hypothetical protein F4V89_29000 [Neorhizobium galegae]CDZ29958.1 Hypothetical protein NGAL_HAMBI490_48260 [Neorhizobium galegae bv. officinalis]